jgi:hypothetical protein
MDGAWSDKGVRCIVLDHGEPQDVVAAISAG